MPAPDLRSRLEGAFAAGLGRLPPAVLRLLAGRPVRIDGLQLDPEVQIALRLLKLAGHRDLSTMTPAEARAELSRSAAAFAGSPAPVARTEDVTIPGPGGPLPARLYVPTERDRALVVYYHGGGWVAGDLGTHDGCCRFLAHASGVAVLSVDYRRAPEYRFPAAVDDALAAFRWAVQEAGVLGVDLWRIAVGGDSAGGNLAAVVARLATSDGGARPAAQLLIYPVTDLSKKHPSYALFREGFFLSEREMDWYRGHYLPSYAAALDPRASPLLAPDLAGLPPAMILTAGFDVLRDEGEAYARRLEAAGVPVRLRRQHGLIHGFCNATGVSRPAAGAMREAATWLREALAPPP